MERYRQIAETILHQIRHSVVATTRKRISGLQAMWCWGSEQFIAMSPTPDSLGGLKFKVSGFKFKGHVYVKLAFDDTYTIELWNFPADQPTKVTRGIYFDQLAEVLDRYIETGGYE